jgi:hypothetical protein
MRFRLITLFALIVGVAVFATACGSTTAPSSVTAITITGVAPAVGATTQFIATGTLSDGTTQDITATASWTSSDPSVATVSAGGAVTGVAAGTTSVFATVGTVSGSLQVTVN